MKVENYQTTEARANLHPHGHRDQTEHIGPHILRIGVRSQPQIVQNWESKSILLNIDQPNELDNTTLIRVMFLHPGRKRPSFVAGVQFSKARWHRKGDKTVTIRLKRRASSSIPHPLPLGQYSGHCVYLDGGGVAVFTFQARTLVKTAEPKKPKTIITPGDPEYDNSLADLKGLIHRVDGLDR